MCNHVGQLVDEVVRLAPRGAQHHVGPPRYLMGNNTISIISTSSNHSKCNNISSGRTYSNINDSNIIINHINNNINHDNPFIANLFLMYY